MPQNFPSAPVAVLASLASPLVWLFSKPGLFDVYAVGIIFLQMTVPQMRKSNFFRTFQREIKKFDYDLKGWRFALQDGRTQGEEDLGEGRPEPPLLSDPRVERNKIVT